MHHQIHGTTPLRGDTIGGGGTELKHRGSIGERDKRGNCSGPFGHGPIGHVRTFTTALQIMGAGHQDMEHAPTGEGGAVPDGLHYRDITPSVPEHLRLGPQTQNIPLNGFWVSPRRCPDQSYLIRRTRIPLQPPRVQKREDVLITELRGAIPKKHGRRNRDHCGTQRILEESWMHRSPSAGTRSGTRT